MTRQRRAVLLYVAGLAIAIAGGVLAAGHFPGGFDWQYTVISALASRKHNPEGSRWLAGALMLAMALLLPAVHALRGDGRAHDTAPRAVTVLQIGLAAALLMGLERLLIFHVSDVIDKTHEALAVTAFACLYVGIVWLYAQRVRRGVGSRWMVALIVAPLIAAAAGQLLLYLDQRDIGWVGVRWRELGVPPWLSLAFWQWLAVAILWFALGYLVATHRDAASMTAPTHTADTPR